MLEVIQLHNSVLDKGIDFPDGDHMGEHVAEPLGIKEVEVFEGGVVVVEENAVLMKEGRGLVEFGCVSETAAIFGLHVSGHVRLKLLLSQHRIPHTVSHLNAEVANDLFQVKIGCRDLLLEQSLLASLGPDAEGGVVDEVGQVADVVLRLAAHLQRVDHLGQAALLGVDQVDEPVPDLSLQVVREARRELGGYQVVVSSHDQDRGVGGPGLDVDQPLLDLVDPLLTVRDLPEHEVEASTGEEVLMGGVVLLLATKVPRSEHHGSKVLVLVPRFLLIGPVTDVNTNCAHAHLCENVKFLAHNVSVKM